MESSSNQLGFSWSSDHITHSNGIFKPLGSSLILHITSLDGRIFKPLGFSSHTTSSDGRMFKPLGFSSHDITSSDGTYLQTNQDSHDPLIMSLALREPSNHPSLWFSSTSKLGCPEIVRLFVHLDFPNWVIAWITRFQNNYSKREKGFANRWFWLELGGSFSSCDLWKIGNHFLHWKFC